MIYLDLNRGDVFQAAQQAPGDAPQSTLFMKQQWANSTSYNGINIETGRGHHFGNSREVILILSSADFNSAVLAPIKEMI